MEEITLADPRESKNTKLLEEVTPIFIHLDHPDRHIMIGTELTEKTTYCFNKILERES